MRGCRPLTDAEVELCAASFTKTRDRVLFLTQVYTGIRIKAATLLKVGDVWRFGRVVDRIRIERRNRKGKRAAHTVRVHPKLAAALVELVEEHAKAGRLQPETHLFLSREGKNKPITSGYAALRYREVFKANEIWEPRTVATHSTRKRVAKKVYERTRDPVLVADVLGHQGIGSVLSYLSSCRDEADAAVLDL